MLVTASRWLVIAPVPVMLTLPGWFMVVVPVEVMVPLFSKVAAFSAWLLSLETTVPAATTTSDEAGANVTPPPFKLRVPMPEPADLLNTRLPPGPEARLMEPPFVDIVAVAESGAVNIKLEPAPECIFMTEAPVVETPAPAPKYIAGDRRSVSAPLVID